MATYFFDTSALVKRYHDEHGTEQVDSIIDDDANEIVVSSLLILETVSAFRRKRNREELSLYEMNQSIGVFFQEALEDFLIVPIGESMQASSFDLILEDDLRTLDSLQLSAGLHADRGLDGVTFVTADEELAAVADRRGLTTVVPGRD